MISPFVPIRSALVGLLPWLATAACIAAPVKLFDEAPVKITQPAPGLHLIDFGRVSFANLRLIAPPGADSEITVHFGEASKQGRVDRKPPGSVRYAQAKLTLKGGTTAIAAPPADKRNTQQPAAILTPKEWGVVLPFRWVEIEGWSGELKPEHIVRQSAFASTWDDNAASFKSSDPLLDRIWELCRYSIKATTFAGVYVDGDRERIPYEADAYLNQLSHYACDPDVQMARDTYDRLMTHPTWPTEWASHMIFMAHADWMQTGDITWVGERYEKLKTKLLLQRTRADGLVVSNQKQIKRDDIVDWPTGERDGYVFKPVNTVVNAFHIRTLAMMSELATALGKKEDAAEYKRLEKAALASFNTILLMPERGAYRDGEGTDHTAQHASLFPLAFGLVPAEHRAAVTKFTASRGMACSVYAAQYLLEALFENGADAKAMELIIAPNDRSWKHMVESGTTITWEAWDQKYKPNQDWNHAWGAAPANLFPRYVIGARPLTPGWKSVLIRPYPTSLKSAEGKIPSPQGPIQVKWENLEHKGSFKLSTQLPPGVTARVELPASAASRGLSKSGKPISAKRMGGRWIVENVSGSATFEVIP